MESQQSPQTSKAKKTINTSKQERVDKGSPEGKEFNKLTLAISFTTEDGKILSVKNAISLPHLADSDCWQDAPVEIENILNSIGVNPFLLQIRREFQKKVEEAHKPELPPPDNPFEIVEDENTQELP